MSIADRAKKPEHEPMIATILGGPGTGKTSLASTFPKPLFLRTQGEAIPRDAANSPDSIEVASVADLFDIMIGLVKEDHGYQTIVIDSVTGLEALFIADVLASDPKAKGINQALGGYGAGPNAVAAQHARVRRAAEVIRDRKGCHVIFIAHADIGRIDPPDSEGYNQYTLRLSGKSMAPYVDSVDLVGFLKQETILKGDEGAKKAITTGDRVLVTYLQPASVSKNRYGITEDIIVTKGENPLSEYLIPLTAKPKRQAKKETPAEEAINETSEEVAAEGIEA